MGKVLETADRLWNGDATLRGEPWRMFGGLEEVADGVGFVASFCNVIAIATDGGLVVVDTSSQMTATTCATEIREWCERTGRDFDVHSIVYTHGHLDHVSGTDPLTTSSRTQVIGHRAVKDRFDRYLLTRGYNGAINRRQFRLPGLEWPKRFRYPDVTFESALDLSVGGRSFSLRHDRGETDDHVWAVIENRSRDYVESRVRAGVLEQVSVDLLTDIGIGARLALHALVHDGFYIRFDRTTHHLNFHTRSGRHSYVYGQAEVVKDLIDARLQTHRPLIFSATDVRVDGVDTDRPVVSYTAEGASQRIECDFVAGCDGSHGVSATVPPPGALTRFVRSYPVAWLGILARTAPVTAEGMYCAHPDGLSVHSMRGTDITRQYLQVPADTQLSEWSDERIWKELLRRSDSDDHPPLQVGEIFDRSLAPLRSVVTDPMQYGSLFLLGDAAHIVPPTGAKGLNLALSDACVLSHALGAYYRTGNRDHLESYSATALPRIWATQSFSSTLSSVLHRFSDDPMEWQLRRARLQRWADSPAEQDSLGEVYFGLPFPTPWRYG